LGDTTKWIGEGADLCVLEEPEHLNWYHDGENWRERFKLVVGVVHTNYISYTQIYQPENTFKVRIINQLMCQAYSDRVVKLSDSLQDLPRSMVCNVHGVRSHFIEEGRRKAKALNLGLRPFKNKVYFIGKVLWAKGHRLLIDYMSGEELKRTRIDVYGEGEDLPAVKAATKNASLDLRFRGARDHADPSLQCYKVFVNPSQTEVLSTTTAEALAMGKFVVIEKHPSNEFFYQFSNTLTYETPQQFRETLNKALSSTPAPLSEAESHALSWAGGTERFLETVEECARTATCQEVGDELACLFIKTATGGKGYVGDLFKTYIAGSGPVSRQRWLNEPRYRDSTSVVEIVNKSVDVLPPEGMQSWDEVYGKEKKHR
jgi:digalactosyldiacylglycerol synthase